MHHIYETKALILSGSASREADRLYVLYTREFGLIRATAQGVREIKSKLRYSLQPYSLSVISLVKGRSGWRITNARLETNLFVEARGTPEQRIILARIFGLLRRLLQGEEKHEKLFDSLESGIRFLVGLPKTSLAQGELLLVLCVLHHLGYLGSSPMLSSFLVNGFWNLEAVSVVADAHTTLVRSVNESLRLSNL